VLRAGDAEKSAEYLPAHGEALRDYHPREVQVGLEGESDPLATFPRELLRFVQRARVAALQHHTHWDAMLRQPEHSG
jgi:hypothetical protein